MKLPNLPPLLPDLVAIALVILGGIGVAIEALAK